MLVKGATASALPLPTTQLKVFSSNTMFQWHLLWWVSHSDKDHMNKMHAFVVPINSVAWNCILHFFQMIYWQLYECMTAVVSGCLWILLARERCLGVYDFWNCPLVAIDGTITLAPYQPSRVTATHLKISSRRRWNLLIQKLQFHYEWQWPL